MHWSKCDTQGICQVIVIQSSVHFTNIKHYIYRYNEQCVLHNWIDTLNVTLFIQYIQNIVNLNDSLTPKLTLAVLFHNIFQYILSRSRQKPSFLRPQSSTLHWTALLCSGLHCAIQLWMVYIALYGTLDGGNMPVCSLMAAEGENKHFRCMQFYFCQSLRVSGLEGEDILT